MPKNLLFTSWYTGLGGGETDLLSIASFLDPDEWTPHLMLPAEGTLSERWRQHGWSVHIVPYRGASIWFVPPIWMRFPVVDKITQLVQQHKIDIISSEYHTLPFAYAAAQNCDIPIMWTVHGWWFKPKVWQRNFFQSIPVVARSQSIRDGFVGNPPVIDPQTIPVIYSGVDTSTFRPSPEAAHQERQQLGISLDTPLVAMVARFQQVKGHHTFQEMARRILQHIPDAQFIVAGGDTFGVSKNEAYRDEILRVAMSDPLLHEHLRYTGFRDDVENVLNAADVVVCASEFESFGKVNLEAMACGKPVVSTNRGGPQETVSDGETGFLVSPDNPQAFADRVIQLLEEPDLYQRMSTNARDRIVENFSAKETAKQYDHFFRELLRT